MEQHFESQEHLCIKSMDPFKRNEYTQHYRDELDKIERMLEERQTAKINSRIKIKTLTTCNQFELLYEDNDDEESVVATNANELVDVKEFDFEDVISSEECDCIWINVGTSSDGAEDCDSENLQVKDPVVDISESEVESSDGSNGEPIGIVQVVEVVVTYDGNKGESVNNDNENNFDLSENAKEKIIREQYCYL